MVTTEANNPGRMIILLKLSAVRKNSMGEGDQFHRTLNVVNECLMLALAFLCQTKASCLNLS